MNFDLDVGQWIVIGLSVFLFAWYILANSMNRKLGIATFRWLRAGLGQFGKISKAEWIGASNMGARLTVTNAEKPFQRIEAHYLLEPREFLPYWLVNRLRGKRDEVLVRFTLKSAPKSHLEIRCIPRHRKGNDASADQLHPQFQIVHKDNTDTHMLEKIRNFLQEYSSGLESITLQPKTPHLEIKTQIRALIRFPAEEYFREIQKWFFSP